jgi:uncharacterized protein
LLERHQMYYTPYSKILETKAPAGMRIRKVTINGGFTCPNIDGTKARGGCTFCNNKGFSPSAGDRGLSVSKQIEKGIAFHRQHFKVDKFIAYFQTYSGTYASVERLSYLYNQAVKHPEIIGIAIGTRPDCINKDIISLLEDLSKTTYLSLELGLQSAFDESLEKINRAHTFADFTEAMNLCLDKNFEICIHAILGLPGESTNHFRYTANALNKWKYHSLKLHPLHVVIDTVLAKQFLSNEYIPLQFEEYINGVVDFLECVPSTVGIQRFTGDAPSEMLLAPLWCKNKFKIMAAMNREFKRRGTAQGFALKSPILKDEG